jgi:hypothetical protein
MMRIIEKSVSMPVDDMIAWSKEKMVFYKYSRIVEFLDTLPMTTTE